MSRRSDRFSTVFDRHAERSHSLQIAYSFAPEYS
ncbi:hypothetical protein STBA_44020 [Streptomyces sp. MP131-18]|nr:hypothetical protein STBA_44020 [Streptomyces sp. MP131-18]